MNAIVYQEKNTSVFFIFLVSTLLHAFIFSYLFFFLHSQPTHTEKENKNLIYMQIAAAPKAAAPKPIEQPKELPKKPIIKKLVSKTLSTKPAPLVEQPPEEKPQINSAQNTATSAQADANDVSVPAVAEAVADKAARCQTPEIPITQDAANAGITSGKVILEVQINADGKVTTAKLLKGTGFHIDSNVIEFAKKMKCQPALKDGKTVAVIKRLQWVVQR